MLTVFLRLVSSQARRDDGATTQILRLGLPSSFFADYEDPERAPDLLALPAELRSRSVGIPGVSVFADDARPDRYKILTGTEAFVARGAASTSVHAVAMTATLDALSHLRDVARQEDKNHYLIDTQAFTDADELARC